MQTSRHLSLRQLLICGALLILFSMAVLIPASRRRDERAFRELCDMLFREDMYANTLSLHYTLAHPEDFGLKDVAPRLPVYRPGSAASDREAVAATLERLRAIRVKKLSDRDAYTYRLLSRSLEIACAMSAYPYYDDPLSPASGAQSQIPILLAEYTFRDKRDVEDYLSLLDQTDEYFEGLLCYEREKASAGLSPAASTLDSVKVQCDTIVTKSALEEGTHFLQTTFAERLQNLANEGVITAKEQSYYLAQNDRLLKTVLRPAYEALADGVFLLEDETAALAGLAAHPEGAAYYELLLRSQTGSDRPVSEIRDILMKRLEAEQQAMRRILTANPELLSRLPALTGADFPLSSAEAMLTDLRDRMAESFPALPPTGPVALKEVSESLQAYCAPAFYLTAPLDDSDTNVIYVNTPKTPDGLELYTTLAHEGYPGHLYQTVYSNRACLAGDEPLLRQALWYGGYLEGWALYAEFLSFDYASRLQTAQGNADQALYCQLEKHNRNMQLCLYSLLDIMIHYENAPFDQAARALREFGIDNVNAARAIYTYIAEEPCNYLKYYLGYLEILDLKDYAKSCWGDAYSDYRFHKFYLDCGPSDFTTLREAVTLPSYFPDTPDPREES